MFYGSIIVENYAKNAKYGVKIAKPAIFMEFLAIEGLYLHI